MGNCKTKYDVLPPAYDDDKSHCSEVVTPGSKNFTFRCKCRKPDLDVLSGVHKRRSGYIRCRSCSVVYIFFYDDSPTRKSANNDCVKFIRPNS